MSEGLHFARKFRVEWDECGYFPYSKMDLFEVLNDLDIDYNTLGDNDDRFECNRDEFTRGLEKLRDMKSDGEEELDGIDIEELIEFFEEAIEHSEQSGMYIQFVWDN